MRVRPPPSHPTVNFKPTAEVGQVISGDGNTTWLINPEARDITADSSPLLLSNEMRTFGCDVAARETHQAWNEHTHTLRPLICRSWKRFIQPSWEQTWPGKADSRIRCMDCRLLVTLIPLPVPSEVNCLGFLSHTTYQHVTNQHFLFWITYVIWLMQGRLIVFFKSSPTNLYLSAARVTCLLMTAWHNELWPVQIHQTVPAASQISFTPRFDNIDSVISPLIIRPDQSGTFSLASESATSLILRCSDF